MKNCSPFRVRLLQGGLCLMFGMLSVPGISPAQEAPQQPYPKRTTASPVAQSRAEQEAEQLVSLSAEKIITLLDREPGLLLQVKKLLVRKAYEQGRILDPEDLTDDALFRLIGRDENIRVLITREIEDRNYVRVKPTRQELEQQQKSKLSALQGNPLAGRGGAESRFPSGQSQEDLYWSERDRLLQGFPKSVPQMPQGQPSSPQPETPVPQNSQRTLLQAQAQYPLGDYGDLGGLGGFSDATSMQRISPDQMSGLMTARMANGGDAGGGGLDSSASALGMSAGGMGASGGMGYESADLLTNPFLNPGGESFTPSNSEMPQNLPSLPQGISLPAHLRSSLPNSSDLGLDHPVLMRRPNPYADVPSLYDLYSQYSRRSPVLTRFGSDVFDSGTGNLNSLPMDMPVGPDYVLGPGDSLTINVWGSVSRRLIRVVDREGHLNLPEVGAIEVAGRTLGDVQHTVQTAFRSQFRDLQADISISRLRAIRVYVVGDVKSPGAYDVSSLSTPLNAALEAGGPTSRGSLRILKHYRGQQLVQNVDVYDLLLHGVRSGLERLEAGDTILVPPAGAEVTISGMVRRPAIYELNGEKDLAEVLELAGGVLPTGTLRHVDVERLEAHESRTMLALDVPENNNEASVNEALEDFKIQDGDKIKISPIVSFADKTVYLDGHVFRPGKYAYRDGMKITDLIKSYKDVLPEPYKAHAEVIRLNAPDYTPQVLAFNLEDAMAGKEQDIALKPFDTVRVFGRYDFEDPPVITVTGAVRDPGDHVTNGVTYLRDAIFLAGNATSDAELNDVQVFRRTDGGKLQVLSVNLSKALAGDPAENLLLEPKDRVFVHKDLAKSDPPVVTIEGEVARPGKYPLGENLTAAGLVRLAGGLTRGAYTQEADLTRYETEQGSRIVSDHVTVEIGKALMSEPDTDARLRDGDVLTIRQLTGWKDVGATIKVEGEVQHPGTYGIQDGERLSSIIARAGGFTVNAYPYGAVFTRTHVREMEEENRADLIRRVKGEEAEVKLTAGGEEEDIKQATLLQYQATLEKLEHTAPAGRLVIHISSNLRNWTNSARDIQVRAGDTIYVPKRPNLVIVNGSVYNPTAITYKPGRDAGWYLGQAGGPTELANKKAVFVIRADGSVVGGPGGLFSGGVKSASMQPGDMVVVPEKTFSVSRKFQNTVQVASILTSVALAVSAAKTF